MRDDGRVSPRRLPDAVMAAMLVAFALFAVFAVVHLLDKPGLPDALESNGRFPSGLTIDGTPVFDSDELEFLLSGRALGETVRVGMLGFPVVLVRTHSLWIIAFDVLLALVVAALGLVVALYHGDRGVARVFLAASLALGMGLTGTKTIYVVHPPWLGMALCSAFLAAYAMIPVLFLHFTTIFPARRFRNSRMGLGALYATAAALAAWQSVSYLAAARAGSVELYRQSLPASIGTNALMVAGLVAGLMVLVGTYRRASEIHERKKAAWVLYGVGIGTLPFILFWALPQMLGGTAVIPEMAFKVFLLAIPASFTIAILRYRLVDITTLISRSAVHAIVIGVLLVAYTLLIAATAGFVARWTVGKSILFSAAAAVLAVLAYDTLRNAARRLVDRSLFRLSYDFRGSLKEVLDGLKRARGADELGSMLVDGIERLMPVDRIGLFALEQPGQRLRGLAVKRFPGLETHGVKFDPDRLRSGLDLPVAVDGHIERSASYEPADREVFARWGMSLAVPMKSKGGGILGFLVLGRKSSGLMFTPDDVDLLCFAAGQAAVEYERISLARRLAVEQAESERLEELNRLKSYFVSSVSHDLRTPLTSIRMFAELLRTRKGLAEHAATEYLEIIEGESERLNRLINNVLDFSKIERGVKEYHRRETDLNDIAARAMAILQYQFTIEHCRASLTLAGEPLLLDADPDALLEALLNLIGNSLKYTGEDKRIDVSTFAREGVAGVSVADNGIGVDPAEVDEIFLPFRRGKGGHGESVAGAGLGLSVVKHIVDAHHGSIVVAGQPGKGSTFTLTFPPIHSSAQQ